MTAEPLTETESGDMDGYQINLKDGYVLTLGDRPSLSSFEVRRIEMYLLAHGYELSDPDEIEPEWTETGVRFFIEPKDGDFDW